jgi:hypothetical protein
MKEKNVTGIKRSYYLQIQLIFLTDKVPFPWKSANYFLKYRPIPGAGTGYEKMAFIILVH